jgi:hypothetical protein
MSKSGKVIHSSGTLLGCILRNVAILNRVHCHMSIVKVHTVNRCCIVSLCPQCDQGPVSWSLILFILLLVGTRYIVHYRVPYCTD